MGTRSITVVESRWSKEQDYEPIATIYRHWDGYPESHGQDIATFLGRVKLVNGRPLGSDIKLANGSGELAAQLIVFLDEEGHNPSLHRHGIVMGQEYCYVIRCTDGDPSIDEVEVLDGPMTAFGMGGEDCTNSIFKGSVEQYHDWIAKQVNATV